MGDLISPDINPGRNILFPEQISYFSGIPQRLGFKVPLTTAQDEIPLAVVLQIPGIRQVFEVING